MRYHPLLRWGVYAIKLWWSCDYCLQIWSVPFRPTKWLCNGFHSKGCERSCRIVFRMQAIEERSGLFVESAAMASSLSTNRQVCMPLCSIEANKPCVTATFFSTTFLIYTANIFFG
jgi:hypothetical protein